MDNEEKIFSSSYEEHKSAGKTIRIQKAHEHGDLSFIFVAKKNINNSTTCMGREREQAILKIQQL